MRLSLCCCCCCCSVRVESRRLRSLPFPSIQSAQVLQRKAEEGEQQRGKEARARRERESERREGSHEREEAAAERDAAAAATPHQSRPLKLVAERQVALTRGEGSKKQLEGGRPLQRRLPACFALLSPSFLSLFLPAALTRRLTLCCPRPSGYRPRSASHAQQAASGQSSMDTCCPC